MRIGISTSCLFPMPTESALELLGRGGAGCVEVFLNSYSEASQEFSKELSRIVKRYNLFVTSVHPYSSEYEGVSFFGPYRRRFDDALDEYKRIFSLCSALGARYVAFHGARKFFNVPDEFYAERFFALSQHAKAAGVTMCHENVVNFKLDNVEAVRALRRHFPDAKFILDIKQAVRSRVSPMEMALAMGEGLCHLHLSDNAPSHDCLAPGRGEFDFARLFSVLSDIGYQGDAVIELYRKNFGGVGELYLAQNYLDKILKQKRDAASREL